MSFYVKVCLKLVFLCCQLYEEFGSLVHIVKISTFYLRRYGQNWPYYRKMEEIYFYFFHIAR
jgi:hypothetical protein